MSTTPSPRTRRSLALGFLALLPFVVFFTIKMAPAPVAESPAVDASHPAFALNGEQIYMSRCMSCHQMNGQGVMGTFPPLVDSEWVTGDKGRLIRIILQGMQGNVEVGGVVYSGAMPGWGAFLSDEEAAQLMTYIRQSWGNEASAVSVKEVAAVRQATEGRKQPWTAAELEEEENSGIPGMPEKEGR